MRSQELSSAQDVLKFYSDWHGDPGKGALVIRILLVVRFRGQECPRHTTYRETTFSISFFNSS